jgi:hypothetical protein
LGRWGTNDPVRFDGKDINLKRYSFNAPSQYADSLGLCPDPCQYLLDYMKSLIDQMENLSAKSADLGLQEIDLINQKYASDIATARTWTLGLVNLMPSLGPDSDFFKTAFVDNPIGAYQLYSSMDDPVGYALNLADALGSNAELFTSALASMGNQGAMRFGAALGRANVFIAGASFSYDLYGNISENDRIRFETFNNYSNTIKNDNDLASLMKKFDDAVKAHDECTKRLLK